MDRCTKVTENPFALAVDSSPVAAPSTDDSPLATPSDAIVDTPSTHTTSSAAGNTGKYFIYVAFCIVAWLAML